MRPSVSGILRTPMQEEVFYIYHLGEQRGPYTARQVNHLHRCGYINDDTMYWREGMEQWHPISEIVELRAQQKRMIKWGIAAATLALITVLAWLFGPVTLAAWRELTSGEYTETSAWWRARGMVRGQLVAGENVAFDPYHDARVALEPPAAATVMLSGNFTAADGHTEHVSWRVRMAFDAAHGEWSPAPHTTENP